jgi:hypothetical protein
MTKINVIYEWIGPQGPLCNARMPNIYDLALSVENVTISDNRRATSAYFYKEVLSKFPENFVLKSASEVTREDIFIYDFQYIYKTTAESLFTFGVPTGLFENSKVSSRVMDGLRNGKGYMLLDFSMESFVYPNFFHLMEQYFLNHQIPPHKVIYMTGCPNGDDLYQNFCDQRNTPTSNRLKIFCWDSFEWNMSKQLTNREYVNDRHIRHIHKTFLSLNYRYRPHRLDLFLAFYKQNLLGSSLFTFPEKNPESPNSFIETVDRNIAQQLDISEEELQYIQQYILPLKIDHLSSDHTRHAEMTMEIGHSTEHFYKGTLLSVVTETHAYQHAIAETEKTFKPIKYRHPFILVGAPNSLVSLKKKGYRTFSNWFDESYDTIDNHRERVFAISNVCKEIDSWSHAKKSQFIQETNEVVDHNFEVLKSRHKNIQLDFWETLR